MAPHLSVESAQDITGALPNIPVDVSQPPEPKCKDETEDHAQKIGDAIGSLAMDAGVVALKKKKKKSKSKSKANKASGFEENYADAPLTPAEFAEEKESLYAYTLPFAERIETCIQRYRARRKFDPKRKDIFDKYLRLGGIDTGNKMFGGGLDPKGLGDMDAQDIARATATDFVSPEISHAEEGDSEFVVDFEAVTKGYFSYTLPKYFDITKPDEVKNATNVVRNFLNYVLHHNVCPEYDEQVNAARAICSRAELELSKVVALSHSLPGDFNMACSTLFGGYYQGLYSLDRTWANDMDIVIGMPDARAKKILTTALAVMGTDEQVDMAMSSGLYVVESESIGFEITEVLLLSEEDRQFFNSHHGGEVKCLAILKGKDWKNPTWPEEDLSDDEDGKVQDNPQEWTFWIEEHLLEHIVVGMKIECVARKLTGGIRYFDTVTSVHCSFFTYLDNERMRSYKAPIMYPDGEAQGEVEAEDEVNEPEPEE